MLCWRHSPAVRLSAKDLIIAESVPTIGTYRQAVRLDQCQPMLRVGWTPIEGAPRLRLIFSVTLSTLKGLGPLIQFAAARPGVGRCAGAMVSQLLQAIFKNLFQEVLVFRHKLAPAGEFVPLMISRQSELMLSCGDL